MTEIDIEKLVEWLGTDGAIGGLESSDLTISALYELAKRHGLIVDKKMRRSTIINELINSRIKKVDMEDEELLKMDYGTLLKYFTDRKVSTSELLRTLSKWDIQPGSEQLKHLTDFAAREISDLGMYQRVARGNRNK